MEQEWGNEWWRGPQGAAAFLACVSEARRHSVKWKRNPFSADEMAFLCLQSISNLWVSVLLGSPEAIDVHGMMNFVCVKARDWSLWVQGWVPSFFLPLSVISKCLQPTFSGWLLWTQYRPMHRWLCLPSIWHTVGTQDKFLCKSMYEWMNIYTKANATCFLPSYSFQKHVVCSKLVTFCVSVSLP